LKAFLDQRVRPNLHFFAPTLGGSSSRREALSVLFWRDELEHIAAFLEALCPSRLDANDAALALVMHVKERTKKRRLSTGLKLDALELLNAARSVASISGDLTLDALDKQLARANRENARKLLQVWESLAATQPEKR
jgi:hypothetical protein